MAHYPDPTANSVSDESADGQSLTIEQAIANLEGDDLGLRVYAAWWLGRFRVCQPAVVQALIQALEDEADRTPEGGYPLRRNAARALGKLTDRQAVTPLIRALDCPDFYVREAAAESLGQLGDFSAILALLNRLTLGLQDGQLIAQQPDFSEPYDALLEALGALQATDTIPDIQPFLEHPIERIQFAAARALYQLTRKSIYGDRLVQALQSDDLQLRRTALSDLAAIGYLPAAEAIAQTHAENSLKLIALRGVLEAQLYPASEGLSAAALQVMALMDDLL